ncbi:MAG: MBL fold metallo-hydrolase [Lentimicrobiaceae bacterium]|nr:MBL fold metallo-hydrolase [Lentimicrobiaceae bacterium]
MKINRREMLKISAGAVGGLALGNPISAIGNPSAGDNPDPSQRNSFFDSLPIFPLGEKLDPEEIRITFLGTSCIPRLSQECGSVYIEVGSGDQFVFDCGTGVIAKYNAMGVLMSKLDKIFFTHLHGDHTSDLTHIYCFGPAQDRKSPLFIWGPSNSYFTYQDPSGGIRGPYEDGTRAFCQHFREMNRWHTESFSFLPTTFKNYTLPAQSDWGLKNPLEKIGDDPDTDGYTIYPIELDWQAYGQVPGDNIAYQNPTTGVTIKHFPAIHCRRGSISFKLEWNGLSVVYSGDTKPSTHMLNFASGADVVIHEIVMPAQNWAEKNTGLKPGDDGYEVAYKCAVEIQNSSHTPQNAYGYIMSQLSPRPRLMVATHFQAEDDTIQSALRSIRNHCPVGEVTFAADLMVINVSKTKIIQRRAIVSDYAFFPILTQPIPATGAPNYWKWGDDAHTYKVPDSTAQLDMSSEIPPIDPVTGKINYNPNGF